MLNNAVIMGRICADPELRQTPSNVPVTRFTVAVDRGYAKQGEEKKTDFINIVAWRQTAEFICKYFGKGKRIGIEGCIQTRKWVDDDGKNRTAFEVLANNVQVIESKKATGIDIENDETPAPSFSSSSSDFTEIDTDDDLPF